MFDKIVRRFPYMGGVRQTPLTNILLGLSLSCFLVSGCIAQKADLVRIQKDLESRITKLDQEKKALEDQLTETNERIAEEKKLQTELRAEMKDMFRARAEIRQELKAVREADLTTMSGQIEEINFRMDKLQQDLNTQSNQITDNKAQTTALIQQVDEDGQSISGKMAEFQIALSAFKDSMTDLGNKLVKETERASTAEAELDGALSQDTEGMRTSLGDLQSDVALLQQDLQTHQQQAVERLDQQFQINATNLQEVSQSVAEMRQALEKSGTLLGGRVDEHADQVVLLQTQLGGLDSRVTTLTEQLNADSQASKDYLERVSTLQANFQGLENQLQSESAQVQQLNQTVLQLREALDVMGSLLGKRGDELVQQSGQLTERLNQIESYQQSTSTHLSEVNASISSVAQALENTSENLATRVTQQEQLLADTTSKLQELQGLKEELEASKLQFQSTIQSANGVQESLQQVTSRIQELETHQSGLVGKLDADSQANITHINQLTETVNKLRDVVNTIGTKLGTRVDKHEERLAELGKRVNSLQGKKKTSSKRK